MGVIFGERDVQGFLIASFGARETRESVEGILEDFLADRSYPDQEAYCAAYKTIFRDNQFDPDVYASLGEGGCR